jgi:Protein of unknown function (DUF3224)
VRSRPLRRLLLSLAAVLLIVAVAVPVAIAAQSVPVSGTFREHSFKVIDQRTEGTDTIIDRTVKVNFRGSFDGKGDAVERVTLHADGSGEVIGQITFTGCVEGQCGTAQLLFEGTSPDSQFFDGQFTVLSGTGQLEGLRGNGEFFQAPNGTYSGTVRF